MTVGDAAIGRFLARLILVPTICSIGLIGCGSAPPELPAESVAASALPTLDEVPLGRTADGTNIRPHNLAVTARGNVALWVRNAGPEQIMTLDSTGSLVASWGRVGEGPGEVRSADLLLSGDSTIMLAGISGEPIRVFTPTGTLIVETARPPVGLPSAMAGGRMIWWTARHIGKGPRDRGPTVERDGPVVNWCVTGECSDDVLARDDSIVLLINAHAPPREVGLWPAFASRGDVAVVGDGYTYRLWRIDLHRPGAVVQFGREIPPRMATDSQIAVAEAKWQRLERGLPGPDGRLVRDNFDREREFIRTVPYPHFQYLGLGFDGRGRLWVIGRDSSASMFVDVFADTTFLGRITIACNRRGYAAAVRGAWFATICVDDAAADTRYRVRLFRIVEPDSLAAG